MAEMYEHEATNERDTKTSRMNTNLPDAYRIEMNYARLRALQLPRLVFARDCQASRNGRLNPLRHAVSVFRSLSRS